MPYTLKLGDSARLVFHNAQNESQALAQLRSAFPQMTRGLMQAKGFDDTENPDIKIRNPYKDIYWKCDIELQEQ